MPNKYKQIHEYTVQELIELGFGIEINEHSERSRNYGHARVKQLGLKVSKVYGLNDGRVCVKGNTKDIQVNIFVYGEGGA